MIYTFAKPNIQRELLNTQTKRLKAKQTYTIHPGILDIWSDCLYCFIVYVRIKTKPG